MRAFHRSNSEATHLFGPYRAPDTDDDHAVAIAQQSLYLNNTLMMAGINLINGSVVALAFLPFVPLYYLIPWVGSIWVFSLLGFGLWRRTRNTPVPKRASRKFLHQAEWSSLALGILWGAPNLLFAQADPTLAIFLMLVSSGTATGFVSLVAPAPRLGTRFVVAVSLPCFIVALTQLEGYSVPIATLVVVLNFALIQQSIRSYEQLRSFVSSRDEAQDARKSLVTAIEAIDDAFAIHDPKGAVTMSNSTFGDWFPDGVDLTDGEDGAIQRINDQVWAMRSVVPVADGRLVSIHTDVSALKVRESQLIAARREAEDASEAKARFMATMSHELRTPLNIINGFSNIMSSKSRIQVTASEMREYADSIQDAGEHLLTVIDDIIEFSNVGSDRYIYAPEAHDPHELIEHALSLTTKFLDVSDRSGITTAIAPNVGELVIDEAAFRRALMNLLSNAIKFGGKPTRMVIRVFLASNGAPVITIRDFGEGIAQEDRERVFEPFFQCEGDRGGEFSGTGLGLALSRQIVRLHGGDVVLSSRVGVGTTAKIVLPAKAHIPPDEIADEQPVQLTQQSNVA